MSGKDASANGSRALRTKSAVTSRWRAVLSWGLGGSAVVGLSALIGHYGGPERVSAQAPVRTAPANAPTNGTVPGRAVAPTRQVAPASGTAPVAGPAAGRIGPTKGGTPAVNAAAPNGAAPNAATPAPGGARPAAVTNPDLKVVALVNGEQLTRQDLARECVRRYGKEVLESMVNKHLILQACQQQGITITQQDVEDEIDRIARKFNLAKDRWLQLLQDERNVSPAEYRREIIWPTLALRTLSADRIQVSEAEIQKAFESEYGPAVRARLISVSSRKKAEDLHKKAMANPAEFNNLAKDGSEDASASVMGLIPPIRKHLGDANMERIAFSLKPGQISPIIPVADMHVILKCEEQVEATYLGGERLKQVRVQLTDRIRDQKMRSASGELFKKLQQEAKVINVLNDPALQQQHPGVAALINNQPVTMRQLSEECIQRHGTLVLDGEINRTILVQELKKKNATVTDADIDYEVGRAAEAYGYVRKDGKPDIDAWLKHVTENDGGTVELYVRDAVWPSAALKKLIGTSAQVNEDDLKKGFDANFGERVEVLAIVLGNQRQAQQVWEMARDNPTDNFFGELAHQYSIEPASRANYGRVPPIRKHGGQPLVEEQAFQLKQGELSSIISLADKFIIMRCTGRTKQVVTEITPEIRAELERDIAEKKLRTAMAKEFDRLKEAAQVDNFLAGTSQSGKKTAAKGARPSSTPALGAGTLSPIGPGGVSGNAPKAPASTAAQPRGASPVVPASGATPVRPTTQR